MKAAREVPCSPGLAGARWLPRAAGESITTLLLPMSFFKASLWLLCFSMTLSMSCGLSSFGATVLFIALPKVDESAGVGPLLLLDCRLLSLSSRLLAISSCKRLDSSSASLSTSDWSLRISLVHSANDESFVPTSLNILRAELGVVVDIVRERS